MKHFSIGHRLPTVISSKLFGDRKKYGLVAQTNDPCWREWEEEAYVAFYQDNQRQSIGNIINTAGYKVIKKIDVGGKKLLELGPGDIQHLSFWNNRPDHLVLADINPDMLQMSSDKLENMGVNFSTVLLSKTSTSALPFADNEFDIILSFYSLEHVFPLNPFLSEIIRCLKKNGHLVGAIPAEGGLAWGGGRFFTSRRWFIRNTTINPDKIICWEHPNFADCILQTVDGLMELRHIDFYPFRLPLIDINLIISFIYRNSKTGHV